MPSLLTRRFAHKIKDAEAIRRVVGPLPRDRKVAMCHGVFDIVHPGHIRHLLYAREKGEILVAGVTADRHITKGDERPFVPEELRAANLAALEIVDFVTIDPNPTPIETIGTIQPDFFVKGFEYGSDGPHPLTSEEMEVVRSYGGEFVFSPGDVVYSSSALLERRKPDLSIEKLLVLMEAEGISFDDLERSLDALPGIRVHLVGDTIIDKYSYCSVLGPTTKTPTFSVRLDRSELFVGGAGIVAKHLRALGAEVVFTTLLGEDARKDLLLHEMEEEGIRVQAVVDRSRPTTMKERFWADSYKLLQVDVVDNHPIPAPLLERFTEAIARTEAQAVVFSDFRHGIFNSGSIPDLSAAIPSRALRAADTQVSNRWGNILEFRGFDLITPNEREARFALGDQDSGIRHLGGTLYEQSDSRHLILKLGERGILTYRRPGEAPRDWFYLDSLAESLVDGIGAGDALLAMATLVLRATGSIVQAAILGNLAAGMACGLEGNIPISAEAVRARITGLRKSAGA